MGLWVQKYGGTSVGDPERIRAVARRCLRARAEGHDLVVVVSAMAGETNRLLRLVQALNERPSQREQDVVVATGEQVTIGLLALAIQAAGGQATSFLADQCRIVTDNIFGRARIKRIDDQPLREALRKGHVAVVAGFQGTDEQQRPPQGGGSDTTAVALAAALEAERCEITDVDGIPHRSRALRGGASSTGSLRGDVGDVALGGKVPRSVGGVRRQYWAPVGGALQQDPDPGVRGRGLEDVLVYRLRPNEAKLRCAVPIGREWRRGSSECSISARSWDLIVQTAEQDSRSDLNFTVTRTDFRRPGDDGAARPELGLRWERRSIAKIIVRVGMEPPGWRRGSSRCWAGRNQHQMISHLEIKVSAWCTLVHRAAVQALHTAFGLDRPQATLPAERAPGRRRPLRGPVIGRSAWHRGQARPVMATLDCPSRRCAGWLRSGRPRLVQSGEALPPTVAGALGLRLPLNDATEDDLARLPGIGRQVARALVAARPFRTWDQVDSVRGVGPARLATLRDRTKLDP